MRILQQPREGRECAPPLEPIGSREDLLKEVLTLRAAVERLTVRGVCQRMTRMACAG